MEITRKIFWTAAMKGGSVIGLAVSALQLTRISLGLGIWMNAVSLAVFALLLYGFTRRIAGAASEAEGFPYARCMGFVLAMMLFTGVIVGFANALMNNFLLREEVARLVDTQMLPLQDMLPQAQFDAVYDTTYSAMFNPLALVLSGVFVYCIQGGVIGLFTSALAQRKPDIFAGRDDRNGESRTDGE